MAVYIYEADAFEKMAAVEQDERWVHHQDEGSLGRSCLFSSFKNEWEKHWKPLQEEYADERLLAQGLDIEGNGAIYGSLGFNRYTVRGNGEIMFILGQSRSDEDTKRAEEQGFRMFPDDMP